jgi:hypothetical protein
MVEGSIHDHRAAENLVLRVRANFMLALPVRNNKRFFFALLVSVS